MEEIDETIRYEFDVCLCGGADLGVMFLPFSAVDLFLYSILFYATLEWVEGRKEGVVLIPNLVSEYVRSLYPPLSRSNQHCLMLNQIVT